MSDNDLDSELSEFNEEDLLSSVEEENDDNDTNSSHADDVSAITATSNKSRKKLDSEIQAEIWDTDLRTLNDFSCNCATKGCTKDITVNQVVNTRETFWGKGVVSSKMRRKMYFDMVASARQTPSKELRY